MYKYQHLLPTIFIDDVDVREYGWQFMCDEHENPLLQSMRNVELSIPQHHGAYDYGANLDPITFAIPLNIYEDNAILLQREIRNLKKHFLDGNGKPKTVKLRFDYEPDKYYNVRLYQGVPVTRELGEIADFVLPLICYEGHAWSVVRNNEVTWGSRLLTFSSPYTFGHMGDGAKTFTAPGSTVFTLAGNNLKPVLHVAGSGTNVTISWGGKTLSLGTFTNSTWIIDLEELEVSQGGMNAVHIIKGDWLNMELQRGDNQINVNGSGLNLTIRAEYRDRYF